MHSRPTHHPSADRPVLRLGLAGFTNAEQSLLNVALASRAAKYQMNWQLTSLGDADAWCVNGSRVQGLPDGTLRITPGLPSGRSIRINPAEIDWPVAFSMPLTVPGFQPGLCIPAAIAREHRVDAHAAGGLVATPDGAVPPGVLHRGEGPRPAFERVPCQRQRQAVRPGQPPHRHRRMAARRSGRDAQCGMEPAARDGGQHAQPFRSHRLFPADVAVRHPDQRATACRRTIARAACSCAARRACRCACSTIRA